jgi:hypothetical protein
MRRVTNGYGEMEFVITPETFHILVFHVLDSRRIFTDGRDFPTDVDPAFWEYPSAVGSTRRATATSTCWKWRRAA